MVVKNLTYALKQWFKKELTVLYPEVKYMPYPRYRARHFLNADECVGCGQCAKICPTRCIELVKYKEVRDHPQIDLGHCMFCDLCVDACPTNALLNTTDFELADYTRQGTVYSPERLMQQPKKPYLISDKYGNVWTQEEG